MLLILTRFNDIAKQDKSLETIDFFKKVFGMFTIFSSSNKSNNKIQI